MLAQVFRSIQVLTSKDLALTSSLQNVSGFLKIQITNFKTALFSKATDRKQKFLQVYLYPTRFAIISMECLCSSSCSSILVFLSILALILTSYEKEQDVHYIIDVIQLEKDTNFRNDRFSQNVEFLANSREPKEYVIKLTVICLRFSDGNISAADYLRNVYFTRFAPCVWLWFSQISSLNLQLPQLLLTKLTICNKNPDNIL